MTASRASLSPESKEAHREKDAERIAASRASLSPEPKEAQWEKDAERKEEEWAGMDAQTKGTKWKIDAERNMKTFKAWMHSNMPHLNVSATLSLLEQNNVCPKPPVLITSIYP